MNKVIIHVDPTITVHELDSALRSIGCKISVGRNSQFAIDKADSQSAGQPPNAMRDELAGTDTTLIDVPSFLRRQGE